jgi:Cu/Ag efflux pump CusA
MDQEIRSTPAIGFLPSRPVANVFYAVAIITTPYLPILTLQRVETWLFRPMAWTVVFALLGAVIFCITSPPSWLPCSSARH